MTMPHAIHRGRCSTSCSLREHVRAQQAFTVEQLLDRASTYVEDLVAKFSRVVAEEQYVQEYLLSGH